MKKIIAFYLPQFHAIPENDQWWGEGFTEWTNVKNAGPLFDGHLQPRVPLEGNYYNLLDDKVKEWQIRIAKENGIYGFCFYHYWFGGKLMLEKPLEQFLANKTLDIPFCMCWANPPWTKIWAGKGSEILIDQDYGDEQQWEKHFDYLLPFLKDERYIKEEGSPILVIYSPAEIPCLEQMISYIRKRAYLEGFPGIKLLYQYYLNKNDEKKILPLFDYCIRFQPIYALNQLESKGLKGQIVKIAKKADNLFAHIFKKHPGDRLLRLRISDYDIVWKQILDERYLNSKIVPCAFVSWDNTPRRGNAGRVIIGSNPQKFKSYLQKLIAKAEDQCSSDFIFITAWNEWSEGSYLEPDTINKYDYLESVKQALNK